jgi:hypothetical protein
MLDLCEHCNNCEEKETEFICTIHDKPSECSNDFEFNINQVWEG